MSKAAQAPEGPQSTAALISEFRAAWRSGQPATLAVFVDQHAPLPPELIADLANLDQEERYRIGDRPRCESYFAQFPQLSEQREHGIDLVYAEYLLREEFGESPEPDDYSARFPQFADALRMQIELHRALHTPRPDEHAADGQDAGQSRRPWPIMPLQYEVLRELGRGGMGVVYLACQRGLDRMVALKMQLAGQHAGRDALARCRREAQTVARLHHPNIVQIYDVGVADGCGYLALEYVPGGNLKEWLAGKPQRPHGAAQFVETLARAMQYAHDNGIVHRDLTPTNVLLENGSPRHVAVRDPQQQTTSPSNDCGDLVPKISDFGLAKQLDGAQSSAASAATRTGDIFGTPSYMAPEQAAGKRSRAGPSVDIYALGAILYELLTGRPPFLGVSPLDTLQKVAAEEPLPVSRLQRTVPRDLETICLKCLEKDPRNRYPTPRALAEDLNRFLTNQPVQARPQGRLARSWRWCRRNRSVAALAASQAVLLLGVAVGATVIAIRHRQQRDVAEANQARAERAEDIANERSAASLVSTAQAVRGSHRVGQRFESLNALEQAARIARQRTGLDGEQLLLLRNEAIASLTLAALQPERTVLVPALEHPTPHTSAGPLVIAVDPRLDRFAVAGPEGNIHVRSLAGRAAFTSLPDLDARGAARGVGFSPDGNQLGVLRGASAQDPSELWDLAVPGPPQRRWSKPGRLLAFAADGKTAAFGMPDGSLRILKSWLDEPDHVVGGLDPAIGAFSPDGHQFASTRANDRWLNVCDLATGRTVARFEHPNEIMGLAFSGDGSLVACGCFDRRVYIWDIERLRQLTVLEGHQKQVVKVAFQPQGDLFASASADGTTRLWDPLDGRLILESAGRFLGFSMDGRRMATVQGNQLTVFEINAARERRLLHYGGVGNRVPWLGQGSVEGLDVSPDGKLLLVAGPDGVRLFHLADGRELARLPIGYQEAVLFDPRGSRFYTHGRSGLRIWPINRTRRGGSELLRIGPPTVLSGLAGRGMFRLACSADGRHLAASDFDRDRAVVFDPDFPNDMTLLEQGAHLHTLAVSPDGAFVAGAPVGQAIGLKVWDSFTGRLVRESATTNSNLAFTPDGRWLIGGGPEDVCLWRAGSWELGTRIPRGGLDSGAGWIAISADGRLLALSRDLRQISLFDLRSHREIARLSSPGSPGTAWCRFSPDSRQLIVVDEGFTLEQWNLNRIFEGLRKLDLQSDDALASPPDPAAQPLPCVEVWSDVIEAESIPAVAHDPCSCEVQETVPDQRRLWSGGRQLLCHLAFGGEVDFGFSVPAAESYRLDVVVDATCSLDATSTRRTDHAVCPHTGARPKLFDEKAGPGNRQFVGSKASARVCDQQRCCTAIAWYRLHPHLAARDLQVKLLRNDTYRRIGGHRLGRGLARGLGM